MAGLAVGHWIICIPIIIIISIKKKHYKQTSLNHKVKQNKFDAQTNQNMFAGRRPRRRGDMLRVVLRNFARRAMLLLIIWLFTAGTVEIVFDEAGSIADAPAL